MKLFLTFSLFLSFGLNAGTIPQSDRMEIKDALLKMCKKSDYIFVGETGSTEDEKLIIDLLSEIKGCGLSLVAVNQPMFNLYKEKIKASGLAHCIIDFTKPNSEVADALVKKYPGKKGKVMVLGNSTLAILKDGQVRSVVDKKYDTSGAVIESITAVMTTGYRLGDLTKAKKIFGAMDSCFIKEHREVEKDFAVKTKDLKSLEFTCIDDECRYRDALDYVFFLTAGSSPSNEEGKRLLEDYKRGLKERHTNFREMKK